MQLPYATLSLRSRLDFLLVLAVRVFGLSDETPGAVWEEAGFDGRSALRCRPADLFVEQGHLL